MTDNVQLAALDDLKELLRAGDITMDQWLHGVAGVTKLVEKCYAPSPQVPNKEENKKPSGPSPRQNAEARRQKSSSTSGPAMKEGTPRIGPSTPLPRDKKEEIQGSPTGVELFLEVEETTRGRTTEGCIVEELDGTELPTESRFIIIYYNRSSGKWTEEQDLQYDDGSSDDGGSDEGEDYDFRGGESSEEWSSRKARAVCLALLVALESADMLTALTEVRRTKTYTQWTKEAELAETMVSLAAKANADESAKTAADGAKMVAAETHEWIAAEPRARAAEYRAQLDMEPPKPRDSDGRGIGEEPSFSGGKVASEQLISGDRLDFLIPNCDAVDGGNAEPSVAYFYFSSMDSAAFTTKEPDENKSMDVSSEGTQDARCKARVASLEERLQLAEVKLATAEGKLAKAEERNGVLELELEESILSCSDAWGDASLWRRHLKELAEDPKFRRANQRFTPLKDDWLCLACDWRSASSVERCPMCGRPSSWCPPRPAEDQPSFVFFNRAEDHPSRGGGGGWEREVASRMQGGWGGEEEEEAGCSWDQGGWGDDEAGEADSGGWDQYS